MSAAVAAITGLSGAKVRVEIESDGPPQPPCMGGIVPGDPGQEVLRPAAPADAEVEQGSVLVEQQAVDHRHPSPQVQFTAAPPGRADRAACGAV
jgi:hypothetical protein